MADSMTPVFPPFLPPIGCFFKCQSVPATWFFVQSWTDTAALSEKKFQRGGRRRRQSRFVGRHAILGERRRNRQGTMVVILEHVKKKKEGGCIWLEAFAVLLLVCTKAGLFDTIGLRGQFRRGRTKRALLRHCETADATINRTAGSRGRLEWHQRVQGGQGWLASEWKARRDWNEEKTGKSQQANADTIYISTAY